MTSLESGESHDDRAVYRSVVLSPTCYLLNCNWYKCVCTGVPNNNKHSSTIGTFYSCPKISLEHKQWTKSGQIGDK